MISHDRKNDTHYDSKILKKTLYDLESRGMWFALTILMQTKGKGSNMTRCRDCGKEFRIKRFRRGYVDQCDSCSVYDVEKYVGRVANDNKGGEIAIFRTDIASVRAQLRCEMARGFSPGLMLGSPMVSQVEVCEIARNAREKSRVPQPPQIPKGKET